LASGVKSVQGAYRSFAALKTSGQVVGWGASDVTDDEYGGDVAFAAAATSVASGVTAVYSNKQGEAFAAVKNGAVIAWGEFPSYQITKFGGGFTSATAAQDTRAPQADESAAPRAAAIAAPTLPPLRTWLCRLFTYSCVYLQVALSTAATQRRLLQTSLQTSSMLPVAAACSRP
jgi:hypothetical protein